MVTVKGSVMWFFREWKNSMTDGLVGVGGTTSSSGIREKGTSLRREPNSRMTLIMPVGAVAACTSYVRPRCESSTSPVGFYTKHSKKRVSKDHRNWGAENL